MGFVDPYFDENIGDLRNLLGAKSSNELKKLEPQIVFANELELESIHIPRTNSLSELLLIHKQLFKNVYDWAGKIRTVDIKKNAEHAEFFLIVSKINDASNYVFAELAKDAGYEIDWSLIATGENDEASRIAAVDMDRSKLERMFTKIVLPST